LETPTARELTGPCGCAVGTATGYIGIMSNDEREGKPGATGNGRDEYLDRLNASISATEARIREMQGQQSSSERRDNRERSRKANLKQELLNHAKDCKHAGDGQEVVRAKVRQHNLDVGHPPLSEAEVDHIAGIPFQEPAVAALQVSQGNGAPSEDIEDKKDSSRRTELQQHPWQPPVPLSKVPPVLPFPLGVYPEPLQRFVREVAVALPCPEDYVAVPLLVIAGGAIGASRALAVKGSHVQRASLYAAVIGPPGSAKSPALELVAEPVHETADRLHATWEKALEEYEVNLERYEAAAKEWKKGGGEDDPPEKPTKPTLVRLTVEDATAESLVPILKENPRGVVLVRDELIGWVTSMNQYREGGKGADQQFWLSAWSGATVTVDRKKTHDLGPLRVRHPFISVVGGLTPDKLPTLRGDGPRQRAVQDGHLDRVLLSYPPEPAVAAENWLEVSEGSSKQLHEVLDKLRSLRMLPVQEGGRVKAWRPFLVKLTGSGREAWQRFTEAHANERNAEDFPSHLAGPWSKLRGYAARMALIVHYLRWAGGEVDDADSEVGGESMDRAAQLIAYFKSHARKVYAILDADQRIADARHVLDWLASHPELTTFSRRDIHQGLRRNRRFENPDNLDGPLDLLEQHGYLRTLPAEPRQGAGRRKGDRFELNPLWERPQCPRNPQNDGEAGEIEGPEDHFEDIEDTEDGSRGDAWEGD
jgi:hypothetical protein